MMEPDSYEIQSMAHLESELLSAPPQGQAKVVLETSLATCPG